MKSESAQTVHPFARSSPASQGAPTVAHGEESGGAVEEGVVPAGGAARRAEGVTMEEGAAPVEGRPALWRLRKGQRPFLHLMYN